jgi:predicted DNA-binding protein YlxM (UPF0122 family)
MLEKLIRVTRLFEIYSGLLPKKQAQLCGAYYLDNLSLGEIAQNEGISRQAVHDSIERAIEAMEEADLALGLMGKSETLASLVDEIKSGVIAVNERCKDDILRGLLEKLDLLSDEIQFGRN